MEKKVVNKHTPKLTEKSGSHEVAVKIKKNLIGKTAKPITATKLKNKVRVEHGDKKNMHSIYNNDDTIHKGYF